MCFGSELITRCVDRDNPMLLVGGIAVIGTMILQLNHRYRQLKARQRTGPVILFIDLTMASDWTSSPPCVHVLATEG